MKTFSENIASTDVIGAFTTKVDVLKKEVDTISTTTALLAKFTQHINTNIARQYQFLDIKIAEIELLFETKLTSLYKTTRIILIINGLQLLALFAFLLYK